MSQEPMLSSNCDHHSDKKTFDGSCQIDGLCPVSDAHLKTKDSTPQTSNPLESITDKMGEPEEMGRGPTNAVSLPHPPTLKTPTASPGVGAPGSERAGRPKGSVQIREPPVSEKHGYKIVKVEQKHGILHRAIPVMPLGLAILLCILNILLPGTGTIISAFTVFCCGIVTRMSNPVHAMIFNLVSGLLQMATFLLIVGWIWSILWGMTFVQLALSAKEDASALPDTALPYYVRRHSSVE